MGCQAFFLVASFKGIPRFIPKDRKVTLLRATARGVWEIRPACWPRANPPDPAKMASLIWPRSSSTLEKGTSTGEAMSSRMKNAKDFLQVQVK